ncbi:MAG TPA: hypothetical protein VIT90_03975 [Lysobacter sp.]
MGGAILHLGASVACAHGGPATPTAPYSRVTVSGRPVVTVAAPYTIAHCNLPSPADALRCTGGQWLQGSTRVFAGGRALVLDSSTSMCVPSGAAMVVMECQMRVTAL